MLSSLLPGLRELRAPLAAGYLWLAVCWIVIEPRLRANQELASPIQSIVNLVEASSILGAGIAISFVAYLIGSLSLGLGNGPMARLGTSVLRRFRPRRADLELALSVATDVSPSELARVYRDASISDRALASLQVLALETSRALEDQLRASDYDRERSPSATLEMMFDVVSTHYRQALHVQEIDDHEAADQGIRPGALLKQMLDELDLVATRLIGQETELYGQVDRLRAESDFRLAVIPPLFALVLTLTMIWNPLWLIGLILLLIYFIQAAQRQVEARDVLVDAIFIGRVKSPTIERLERSVTEVSEEYKRQMREKEEREIRQREHQDKIEREIRESVETKKREMRGGERQGPISHQIEPLDPPRHRGWAGPVAPTGAPVDPPLPDR